jgi:hypothetical protein
LVYKFLDNDLPPPFANYFKQNCDTHNHNTRLNKNLHIDRTHSTQTTKVTGANAYNSIPEAISSSGTLKTFASNLKKHLIGLYSEIIYILSNKPTLSDVFIPHVTHSLVYTMSIYYWSQLIDLK